MFKCSTERWRIKKFENNKTTHTYSLIGDGFFECGYGNDCCCYRINGIHQESTFEEKYVKESFKKIKKKKKLSKHFT